MERIPQIQSSNILIRRLDIPEIGIWKPSVYNTTAPYVPVTLYIGKPIVDIPGCVEVHPENKWPGGNKNKKLAEDDKTVTYCDANTPSFTPMNYEPEQLTIVKEIAPPPVQAPPEPPGSPETPETGGVTEEEVPCPGLNAPRIGTLGPNEKEKVSGYELQKDPVTLKEVCVILYEPISAAEQYLPSAQVASTTAVIATVAGASALLAKPLADLLLRVFRPAIKTGLTKIQKILGKTPTKPTRSDLRADEYRKKKGLPPLKKK